VRTCARRCHSAQGCPLRLGRGGFVVVFFSTAHVPDTQCVTFTVTTTGTEFFEQMMALTGADAATSRASKLGFLGQFAEVPQEVGVHHRTLRPHCAGSATARSCGAARLLGPVRSNGAVRRAEDARLIDPTRVLMATKCHVRLRGVSDYRGDVCIDLRKFGAELRRTGKSEPSSIYTQSKAIIRPPAALRRLGQRQH
jgi:hypothetical protein